MHPDISPKIKRELEKEVKRCIKIAEERFKVKIKPRIVYVHPDGNQRVAGTAFYADSTLYYNPWYLNNETEQFMKRTVPHEVAHLVVRQLQEGSKASWRIDPHGPLFRKVMTAFGVKPENRTEKHDFDVLVLPQYQKCSIYKCVKCNHIHVLRQNQHQNLLENPTRYGCTKCNGDLKFERNNQS